MFSHVIVGSNDLDRSRRFYDAVPGTLGAGAPILNLADSGHSRLFYRHGGAAPPGPCARSRRQQALRRPSRLSGS